MKTEGENTHTHTDTFCPSSSSDYHTHTHTHTPCGMSTHTRAVCSCLSKVQSWQSWPLVVVYIHISTKRSKRKGLFSNVTFKRIVQFNIGGEEEKNRKNKKNRKVIRERNRHACRTLCEEVTEGLDATVKLYTRLKFTRRCPFRSRLSLLVVTRSFRIRGGVVWLPASESESAVRAAGRSVCVCV